MMPQDLIEGFCVLRALTNSGSLVATPGGGFLPKKAPRFFCFSGVLGGYLGNNVRDLRGEGCVCQNIPLDGARLALEPVRDKDLVLLVVAGGEDIGALDGLVKVAEDVVDDDNSFGGIGRAGDIYRESKASAS